MRPHHGFTLLEMVVTICAIALLYMVAERRMNELPGAGERAAFLAALNQIKTGVNLEVLSLLADGQGHELRELEGTNPMTFLIEKPANYRGELVVVTDAVPQRGAWYFETTTGDLVYVVGAASVADVSVAAAGGRVNPGQIRLRLMNVYEETEPVTESDGTAVPDTARPWQGLTLRETDPYTWVKPQEDVISLN